MKRSSVDLCDQRLPAPCTRREMLSRTASGFGGLVLLSLLNDPSRAEETRGDLPLPHFPPKVKNVIFLCMVGGPSQVDTFDYKPALETHAGQRLSYRGEIMPPREDGRRELYPSPLGFRQHGECGRWVCDALPHLAGHVDDMAFIYSMVAPFPEHANAQFMLHTGHNLQGRPSLGAWIGYGLGSENENLPRYVVIKSSVPPGGIELYGSGFLSAHYQGSIMVPNNQAFPNTRRQEQSPVLQQNKLECMRQLDAGVVERLGCYEELESAIENYELAARMQTAVPDLVNLNTETAETKRLYGMESQNNSVARFGKQCLLARRLVERGVRFVELTCGVGGGWDHHGNLLSNMQRNCLMADAPIAALLTDLKRTGLWDETLVIWAGEFGRTPFGQGEGALHERGRGHNPHGFTVWMAGGGVQGGVGYGATDELGFKAVENRVEIHDFHATILHLLGLDHERLTFPHEGRPARLTDNAGRVVHEILS